MPTIVELGSIQIRIYARDHAPPHFHISTPYGEGVMLISNLKLTKGRLKSADLRRVVEWALENKRLIENEWTKQNG